MKLKMFLLGIILLFFCSSCIFSPEDDGDDSVTISFILKNSLLWHISHDYKVGGINEKGDEFMSEELDIAYSGVLLDGISIQKNSIVKLYRDDNLLWTSDEIDESCTITYTDSAYDDYVDIE